MEQHRDRRWNRRQLQHPSAVLLHHSAHIPTRPPPTGAGSDSSPSWLSAASKRPRITLQSKGEEQGRETGLSERGGRAAAPAGPRGFALLNAAAAAAAAAQLPQEGSAGCIPPLNRELQRARLPPDEGQRLPVEVLPRLAARTARAKRAKALCVRVDEGWVSALASLKAGRQSERCPTGRQQQQQRQVQQQQPGAAPNKLHREL